MLRVVLNCEYKLCWVEFRKEFLCLRFPSCPLQILLTTQFPLKLSEKVLQVLINIFLYHDFSVQNFIKGFQVGDGNENSHYGRWKWSVIHSWLLDTERHFWFLFFLSLMWMKKFPLKTAWFCEQVGVSLPKF